MSFFPFIESIFYLSLGIIVVLIFLIVFHFKQRIESLEKKSFLFTEMYNSLVKELNIMKTIVYSPPNVQQKQNILFSTEQPPNMNYNKIIVMDKLSEVDEEESDSEMDSDTDSDTDCEELDNLEVVDLELETETEPENKKSDDLEEIPENSINVLKLEPEPEPEMVLDSSNVDIPSSNSTSVSYNNMTLNELKKLIITKGLSTNPKLKRAEILKLLEEETI